MILGRITGKITTTNFMFKVDANPKKFDYVQVYHPEYDYVLAQINEIERTKDQTLAHCIVMGYIDDEGKVQRMRTPFEPETEVLLAEDEFIKSIIKLDSKKNAAYMGYLEGKKIPVYVNLNKILTKHLAVLAKSGAGKSYTVGVLLEEIIDKGVPLLVIDPHGEYQGLKFSSEDSEEKLESFGITKKAFFDRIQEFGDPDIVENVTPIKLPQALTSQEIMHLIPGKLSPAQQNVLYSALKDVDKVDFATLLGNLELEESNAKFSVMNIIDYLQKLNIFSMNPTPYNEVIHSGKCSVINLKGIEPQIQEIIVAKLMTDLFELRKKEKVPPFFVVIEEAHNFCPERSFGEKKSSNILRNIASEGRKFGLGLAVVSQRPARVDKSVLSQCSTQMILKVTNPNDLKAISNSVEGITTESEKEIMNLSIGSALITGVVDTPLFVNVRPKMTKHGGESIDMLNGHKEEKDFMDQIEDFGDKEILPVVQPKVSAKDLMLMEGGENKKIKSTLIPAALLTCQGVKGEFNLLVDLTKGGIVFEDKVQFVPDLSQLAKTDLLVLKQIFTLGKASSSQIAARLDNDITGSIQTLLANQYVLKTPDNQLVINSNYVFTSLENRKTFRKTEYIQVVSDEKMPPVYNLEELRLLISKLVPVTEVSECWIQDLALITV